jgi:integrase
LAERRLSETTRERYEYSWRLYILPAFEHVPISHVREAAVRKWRSDLLIAGSGTASVAKAYRLMHAMMTTAVEDGLIRRNPCRIKSAGADGSAERPILRIDQVLVVAEAVPARYRMLVLLATFTSLRFGELAALRRGDIDTGAGFLWVRRSQAELSNGRLLLKEPKTSAGRRRVAIPTALLDELVTHLAEFSGTAPDGLVFVGPKGGPLRRQNFRTVWNQALSQTNAPRVHFHDLRHTGNVLAAEGGATIKELMERMGHASPRAAMIYQHAASDRDRRIAEALSLRISSARKTTADTALTDGSAS